MAAAAVGAIMTPEEIETISNAAALLDGMALDLRCAHNLDFANPTWEGEESAKRLHDQAKGTSDALLTMIADHTNHLDVINAIIDAQEAARRG